MKNSIQVSGLGILKGTYSPPGDKSVSHRAVMFGALAEGTGVYPNFLQADDCLNTLRAFQALGIQAEVASDNTLTIHGKGLRGLKPSKPHVSLDLGNSGTSIRLLLGILAGQPMTVTLTGDASLSNRPMKRVTGLLKKMGAAIDGRDDANYAPLTITGGNLRGIDYVNSLGSAQVKSAVLLAGLYAEGETRIQEVLPCRDHTERFLRAMGAPLRRKENWITLRKVDRLNPLSMTIPGDISSAAFFIAGAAMTPGSELTIRQVGLNPLRTGILDILKRMGADIQITVEQEDPEPIGTLVIRGGTLKGTQITKKEIPSVIDELPVLMVAMALSQGESRITGAEELRVKETDRIVSMVTNLKALGVRAEELPDGCVIQGQEFLNPGKVQSYGDHRTAMSFAIGALRCRGEIEIQDIQCVATSFPGFFNDFHQLRKF